MFTVTMGGVSSPRCDNVTSVASVANCVRGRGHEGRMMQTLALKQYCGYVTRNGDGGRRLSQLITNPPLSYLNDKGLVFRLIRILLFSNPEGGVTASTIFICRKIIQCLLYPCFLGRGPIISCIFYLYIGCFYARLNTMYASLVQNKCMFLSKNL